MLHGSLLTVAARIKQLSRHERFGTVKIHHLIRRHGHCCLIGNSLALVIVDNWYRNFREFRKKREKGIPRKVLLFFRKHSTGMNRSIWILPGITGISVDFRTNGKRSSHVSISHIRNLARDWKQPSKNKLRFPPTSTSILAHFQKNKLTF